MPFNHFKALLVAQLFDYLSNSFPKFPE